MYPTLLSIGLFSIKTITIFKILFFLSFGFILWKRSREEHYNELEFFDSFLLSFLIYILFSRLAFIILNFTSFGFNIIKWIDLINYQGSEGLFGLIAMGVFFYIRTKVKKLDTYEVMDFWVQALSMALVFMNLGLFFAGTTAGRLTELPVGIIFPGTIEKRHPVELYSSIFYFGLFFVLMWLENNYRTFNWYRSGKKSAQTGFLFCTFLIFSTIFALMISYVRLPKFTVNNTEVDLYFNLLALFLALLILLNRSGKLKLPFRKSSYGR